MRISHTHVHTRVGLYSIRYTTIYRAICRYACKCTQIVIANVHIHTCTGILIANVHVQEYL